jgi:hypothetical protein
VECLADGERADEVVLLLDITAQSPEGVPRNQGVVDKALASDLCLRGYRTIGEYVEKLLYYVSIRSCGMDVNQ